MSRSQSFYHGTSDQWAAHIVNNGQRANMSLTGNYGRGLYLTPDPDEARSFANAGDSELAVVEGTLRPDAKVHTLTREDTDSLLDVWKRTAPLQNGTYSREANKWTSGFARQGYHVLRDASTGYHVAIRPNAFLPRAVHYPEGSVDLR
jgi:hypothetical protein